MEAILGALALAAVSFGVDWIAQKANKIKQYIYKVDDQTMAKDVYGLIQQVRQQASEVFNEAVKKDGRIAEIAAAPTLSDYLAKIKSKTSTRLNLAEKTLNDTNAKMNEAETRYYNMQNEQYRGLGTSNRKNVLINEIKKVQQEVKDVETKL